VYAFRVNDELKYVGECEDLAKRVNAGYGNIAQRAMLSDGQRTNCRVNALVLAAVDDGASVRLFFHETQDRFAIEHALLTRLPLVWNRKRSAGAARGPYRPPSAPAARREGATANRETNGETCRSEVLAVVRDLARGTGDAAIPLAAILQEMHRRGTRYKDATITTHVTAHMCIDSPSPHYGDLKRVGRGVYAMVDRNGAQA